MRFPISAYWKQHYNGSMSPSGKTHLGHEPHHEFGENVQK